MKGPLGVLEAMGNQEGADALSLLAQIASISRDEINLMQELADQSQIDDSVFDAINSDQTDIDLSARGVALDGALTDGGNEIVKILAASGDQMGRIYKITSLLSVNAQYRFWGSLLSMFNIEIDPKLPTACLSWRAGDVQPTIKVGEPFLKTATDKQVAFVMLHEILHFILLHPWRAQQRDAEFFNYAADREINTTIINAIGNFNLKGSKLNNEKTYQGTLVQSVPTILFLKGERTLDGLNTEILYEEERKQAQDQNKGDKGDGGAGGGNGVQGYDPGGNLLDDHDWGAVTNAITEEEAKEKIKSMVENAGRLAGHTPQDIDELIKGFKPGQVRWENLIHSWVDRVIDGDEYRRTWSKFNPLGDVFPGKKSKPIPVIDTGWDVSGSMSDEMLKSCISETLGLANHYRVRSVQIDTHIKRDSFTDFDADAVKNRGVSRLGCGGTDMNACLQFYMEQDDPGDVCIIFTDGYIPEIDPKLIYATTLFVVTEDGSTDFAKGRKDFSVIKLGGGRDN